jgi:hypothetical protein
MIIAINSLYVFPVIISCPPFILTVVQENERMSNWVPLVLPFYPFDE